MAQVHYRLEFADETDPNGSISLSETDDQKVTRVLALIARHILDAQAGTLDRDVMLFVDDVVNQPRLIQWRKTP